MMQFAKKKALKVLISRRLTEELTPPEKILREKTPPPLSWFGGVRDLRPHGNMTGCSSEVVFGSRDRIESEPRENNDNASVWVEEAE